LIAIDTPAADLLPGHHGLKLPFGFLAAWPGTTSAFASLFKLGSINTVQADRNAGHGQAVAVARPRRA
jgi:hypothetical protein